MRKAQNTGDDRNKGWCVHCGGPNETRDHAPSVVFLDDPLPPDLPVSPSCAICNQGFSNDEAYVTCLLECVMAGGTDLAAIERKKVSALMRHRPALVAEMEASKQIQDGQVSFVADQAKVSNVILKLARCHAAYEFNEPRLDVPSSISSRPLALMLESERDAFECGEEKLLAGWPEVGSRAMERLLILGSTAFGNGWLEVQENRYRYHVSQDHSLCVRMVIREYLAGEVVWD